MQYALKHCTLCLLLALASLSISGCHIKLVSSYDETTDKNVTALQKKVESHLVELESQDGLPECSYNNHKTFYNEAKVDISAISVRAAAIPQNSITVAQTELLADSLKTLEALHQSKTPKDPCIHQDEISVLRTAFNSSFTAILKLEIAKRRD